MKESRSAVTRLRSRPPVQRRRPHRRGLPPISILPTLFTLGNLVAGFAAIHYAAKPADWDGPWEWTGLTFAGILVFVGMFFDGVDGSVARLTRSSSSVGAQLDSLCDMVTFGVAPAFMGLRLVITHLEDAAPEWWVIGPDADTAFGRVIWGVAAAYVCCAALRLARFNLELGGDPAGEKKSFRGLPTPGAAGAVVSLVILHQHLLVTRFGNSMPHELVQWSSLAIPFVMLLCAFGMVSTIPYIHFTNTYIRGRKNFASVGRLVIALALAIWWLQETLAVVFTLYALSGPARVGWRWLVPSDGRVPEGPTTTRPPFQPGGGESASTSTSSRSNLAP